MFKKTAIIGTFIASMGIVVSVPASAEAATVQDKAYKVAKSKIGSRYVYGTAGPNTFDCSGLIHYSFNKAGKKWKRYSAHNQRRYLTKDVTASQRKVGDLIFFRKKGSSTYSHAGIYAGSGYMVNAVNGNTYKGVRKGKVKDGYWNKYYVADYRRAK